MDVKIKSSDVWTWLLVTVVSVMIWIWAAGETREEAGASMRIRIVPPDESEWIVSPREFTANVEMTGSRFAIQNARNLRMPLELRLGTELPAATGVYNSNVASLLDRAGFPISLEQMETIASFDEGVNVIRLPRKNFVKAGNRLFVPLVHHIVEAVEIEVLGLLMSPVDSLPLPVLSDASRPSGDVEEENEGRSGPEGS